MKGDRGARGEMAGIVREMMATSSVEERIAQARREAWEALCPHCDLGAYLQDSAGKRRYCREIREIPLLADFATCPRLWKEGTAGA